MPPFRPGQPVPPQLFLFGWLTLFRRTCVGRPFPADTARAVRPTGAGTPNVEKLFPVLYESVITG